MGTAGAILNCLDQIYTEDIFVVNGDTFAVLDYLEMYDAHKLSGSTITMALAEAVNIERYGVVKLNLDNEIIKFEEKSNTNIGAGMINMGVYLFKSRLLKSWPAKRPLSLEKDVLQNYIGYGLSGFLNGNKFIDIGTPESYILAEEFIRKLKL